MRGLTAMVAKNDTIFFLVESSYLILLFKRNKNWNISKEILRITINNKSS